MLTILLVDDDPAMRRLMFHYLRGEYLVIESDNGLDAIEISQNRKPDMVLLNVEMPGIDGLETCRRLKALPKSMVPVVTIVSSNSELADLNAAYASGADDYIVKPINRVEFLSRIRLQTRLRRSATSIEHLERAEEAVQSVSDGLAQHLAEVQDSAILMLAKLAETRDSETGEHLNRICKYTGVLAQELRRSSPYAALLDEGVVDCLVRSSALHDIGKVGIPDSVLLKPGRLTPDEMDIMRRHTVIGADILEQGAHDRCMSELMTMAAAIARSHHERWNGAGYPDGLRGDQIPLPARIVAVADVFDALTTARPYKPAWTPEAARDLILRESGVHFDPLVAEAFERCFDAMRCVAVEDARYANVNGRDVAAANEPPLPVAS